MKRVSGSPLGILLLAVTLSTASTAGTANESPLSLDDKYQIAKKTIKTRTGKAFDKTVSQSISIEELVVCYSEEGDRKLSGVFEFIARENSVNVIFEQTTPFANCIAEVLEAQPIPQPPSFPYYLPLSIVLKKV